MFSSSICFCGRGGGGGRGKWSSIFFVFMRGFSGISSRCVGSLFYRVQRPDGKQRSTKYMFFNEKTRRYQSFLRTGRILKALIISHLAPIFIASLKGWKLTDASVADITSLIDRSFRGR